MREGGRCCVLVLTSLLSLCGCSLHHVALLRTHAGEGTRVHGGRGQHLRATYSTSQSYEERRSRSETGAEGFDLRWCVVEGDVCVMCTWLLLS